MATSSSIFSTHGSTPPKSDSRTVGGAYSLVKALPVPTRLRLLPSSPRVNRSLRLLEGAVEDTFSEFSEAEGTGSARGGSSELGPDVGGGGGGVGGVALGDGAVGVVFKLTFLLCQRPCMDLLRALGPWLTRGEDHN